MFKLNRPHIPFLIICIFIFSNIFSKASDFENWTFIGGETKIKNIGLSFHSANFFRNGNGYFLNHTQVNLDFPSKSNFSFGIGYKQEYVDLSGKWRREYRPMLHLYYSKNWGNFKFIDRSRWEFRFIESELINRYRNQFQFIYSKLKKIAPYFSSEFSFYFNKLDYTRQRTIIGTYISMKSVNLNLFLGHQINEDFPGIWINKIILGTGLSYSF